VSQRAWRVVAYVLAGAVLVGAGFWGGRLLPTHTATPQVLTGTVREVGGDGDEFVVSQAGSSQAASYALSQTIPWRGAGGGWTVGDTSIPCMQPLSHGQQITFGVINTNPVADALGGPVVVWVECPG